MVDATINQKARYVVPTIAPTIKYVTNFENIDIAVGFEDYEDLKKYFAMNEDKQELDYDYVLLDVDSLESFNKFDLLSSRKNYFVTSFDNYSLKKGLEILSGLQDIISLTKILYSQQILKEENDYLDFLSLGYKVVWNEYRIYFPIENGDLTAIYENHRLAKIKFRRLSIQYKDSLASIAEEILGDVSETNIRRAIKMIEKGA